MLQAALYLWPMMPDMDFIIASGDGWTDVDPVLSWNMRQDQVGFTLPSWGVWDNAMGHTQRAIYHMCLDASAIGADKRTIEHFRSLGLHGSSISLEDFNKYCVILDADGTPRAPASAAAAPTTSVDVYDAHGVSSSYNPGPMAAGTTHHLPGPLTPPAPSLTAPAPEPAQPPAAAGLCQIQTQIQTQIHQLDHDPSRVWIPELIDRIAAFLPNPNQVPLCLRRVNRAAAAHLRRRRDLTVRLSLPAPHAEFVWRFGGGSGACLCGVKARSGDGGRCQRSGSGRGCSDDGGAGGCGGGSGGCGGGGLPPPHTTSWQIRQLMPLTARSGAVENLPVAAAALRAAFTPPPQQPAAAAATVDAPPTGDSSSSSSSCCCGDMYGPAESPGASVGPGGALPGAAATGGSASTPSAGELVVAEAGTAAIAEAAGSGQAAAAAWLVRAGGFAATKAALERAARAGDEGMCRWLLGPEGGCPWTFAAPAAALRAGHARLGEWLMRRRPSGAGTGSSPGSGVPSCASLTSLSLLPAAAAAPGAAAGGCGDLEGGGGAAGRHVNGGDDGPAPQRPGQALGGRRTWLDCLLTAAARGCSAAELAALHEHWLDSRGATIEGPGRNLVLAAAAGSPTADWADKVAWLADAGYWSGTTAAAEAAAAPDGRARLAWLEGRGHVVGEDALEAAARAGQLDVLTHLLTERRLRLSPAGGAAALHGAVGAGQLAAVQLLVAVGGCRPDGPQLLRAAAGGDVRLLTWLLDHVAGRLVSTATTTTAAAAAAATEPAIAADELLLAAAGSEATAGSAAVLQALWDWSWSDAGGGGAAVGGGDGGDGGGSGERGAGGGAEGANGGGGGGGGAGGSGDVAPSASAPAITAPAAVASAQLAYAMAVENASAGGGGASVGSSATTTATGISSSATATGGCGSGVVDGVGGGREALRRAWRCPGLFAAAVAVGSEEKAAWLAARGCAMPADGNPYVHAALAGDLPMLRRLQQLGCGFGLPGVALAGSSTAHAAGATGGSARSSSSSPCACGSPDQNSVLDSADRCSSGARDNGDGDAVRTPMGLKSDAFAVGGGRPLGGDADSSNSTSGSGSGSSGRCAFMRALYCHEGLPTLPGPRRGADEAPLRWLAAAQQQAAAAAAAAAAGDGCSSGGGGGGIGGLDWEAALAAARTWRRGDGWLHAWLESEVAAVSQCRRRERA
ncbi:hypothetical protein HXX76_003283 [Chlamydomonas incerta]|uniref:Uncharacterized protein n=1 Tax=Chlamydomonas incerta TaxID=51695 RepID=A0A835TPI8_CHLIN|nr:hypothetical protein HXX76_003283 [Chlamydomonas incerta]|eukprot:KAG2441665.1 hypothetical protein HXX76_003283 [Chlamydomonas incerta]